MLVMNGAMAFASPTRLLGGIISGDRQCWGRTERMNRFAGGVDQRSGAMPSGHLAPSAWVLPRKTGGMSAFTGTVVTVTPGALNLAAGRAIAGSSTLTFSVPNAALQLVVSANGTATVTFSGGATLAGALSGAGATTVAFSVPTPTLGAVISALASTAVTWSGSGTARATGALTGNITPFTELSPQNLANAVWAQILESDLDAAEVMRVLLAVSAGKTAIAGTTVTFRDRADTKNRVTAVMTGSTRTTITLDPS